MVIDRAKCLDVKEIRQLRTVTEAKAIVDGPPLTQQYFMGYCFGARVHIRAALYFHKRHWAGATMP